MLFKSEKTFVGCRLSGIVVNVNNISEKSRFIVDQFNKGEKGAGMGIVCRGWDVDDSIHKPPSLPVRI